MKPPTSDDRIMFDLWVSVYYFPAVTVADELGLFAALEHTPQTAADLAASLSLTELPTVALLGMLASLGLLIQYRNRFHLTAPARNFLLPHSPYYWGGVLHPGRTDKLHQLIRKTLQSSESKRMTSDWAAGQLSPELAARITQLMHSHSVASAMWLAQGDNFAGVRRLLDVGGGSGCYCSALALQHPQIHCTVMELPVICDLTHQYIAQHALQDRIDTIAADMFKEPWPDGYDAIFFSDILHDWNRERCLDLARRSFACLPSGGRLFVHEILVNDTKDGPLTPMAYFLGLTTLTEGEQFTAPAIEQLLGEADFVNITITPSNGYYSLISATKP